jgi:hypothetical protein
MTEVPPLVVEATKKAGLIWLAVPGQPRAMPVWFVWQQAEPGHAAYVVTGPGEQPVPGLAEASECAVTVPSADKRSRIVTWAASVRRVEPGSAEWDEVLPTMLAKRLNLAGAETAPARWAQECAVLRLAPTGEILAAGPSLPTGSLAAPPAPSPARTATRIPYTLHRRPRRAGR